MSRSILPLSVSLLLLALCGPLAAQTTIYVDASNPNCPGSGSELDPYCQIQTGINAADTGDIVLVAPGVYYERIDALGKGVAITSSTGPTSTIIDGQNQGSVATFAGNENLTTVLSGFTLRNGSAPEGAGIRITGSSPTIQDNLILECAGTYGAGISISDDSRPSILSNTIIGNTAVLSGGGVRCRDSSPLIAFNDIIGNRSTVLDGGGIAVGGNSHVLISGNNLYANSCAGLGGGIAIGYDCSDYPTDSSAIVQANTIDANFAFRGGGVSVFPNGFAAAILNNTISRNSIDGIRINRCSSAIETFIAGNIISGNVITGVAVYSPSRITQSSIFGTENGFGIDLSRDVRLTINSCIIWNDSILDGGTNDLFVVFSNVQGGWPGTGNSSVDPLFVDALNGDFSLQPGSPCIDTGDPMSPLDPDGSRADRGAVPFCHVGVPLQVFPTRGPYLGGNLVTIMGTDFTPSSSVLFDGVAASVTFVSDTTLVVQPPPHQVPPPTVNPPSGQQQLGGFGQVTVDVTVTNLCGTQTLEDAYTYVAFRR